MKWYHYILILLLAAAGLLGWYFTRRQGYASNAPDGTVTPGVTTFTAADAQAGLAAVKKQYGAAMARDVERLTRFETGHYTSQQFKYTGTAGMVAVPGSTGPFYGWYSNFFALNPQYTPVGTLTMNAPADQLGDPGGQKRFIIFPSVTGFMLYLADYATRHANDGGIYRWASTSPATQATYKNYLAGVKTSFTDNLT